MLIVNTICWQGCVYDKLPGPIQCDENPVVVELVSVEDSNCALTDGSLEVRASGGTGNYRFHLGDNSEQLASVFSGLAAGVYEATAADDNDCSGTLEVVVKNKTGMNITFETTVAGCNASNGSIILTPFGGTAPYNYKIGNSAFSTDSTFTDLSPGNYTIAVNDLTGCEVTQEIKIRSGVSFSGSISSIIQTNCIVSGCHNGSQFPDFRVFKNIVDNAAQIKKLTGNRTMPEEGSLTQAEIDIIACWIDDGAANN